MSQLKDKFSSDLNDLEGLAFFGLIKPGYIFTSRDNSDICA